jgi:hypothetical protein
MYSGNKMNQETLDFLDIKKIDGCIDSRLTYHKVVIATQREIRASALKRKIECLNNTKLSESNKIILRSQSEYDDLIMTFSRKEGESIHNSGFYKSILEDPTHYSWTRDAEAIKKVKLDKQLHIDMAKPFHIASTSAAPSIPACDGTLPAKPVRAKRPAATLLDTESEGDEPPIGDGGAPGASVAKPKGRAKLQARRLQPGDKGYRSLESRMLDCAVTLATRMPVPQGSPPLAPVRAVEAPGIPEFSLVPPADGQAAFSLAPVAPVARDPQELMTKIYGLEKDNAVLAKTEEMLTLVVEAKNECIHKANECIQQANLRVDAKDQHLRDLVEAKDKLIDILARGSHQ